MDRIGIDQIRTDGGTQSRVQINWIVASEYAADMKAGDEFPPIIVFDDGRDCWLADGFHRVEAAKSIDIDHIAADVRRGTVRDARLYSLGANKNRGLRLSNADKKKIVLDMLADEEWREWANTEIGRHCGVSHDMVRRYRESILHTMQDRANGHRKVKRNGTTYTVDTTNIGKAREPDPNDQPSLVEDHFPEDGTAIDIYVDQYIDTVAREKYTAVLEELEAKAPDLFVKFICGDISIPDAEKALLHRVRLEERTEKIESISSNNAPIYLNAIEAELQRGATPERIYRFVLSQVGPDRSGIAIRCQQAARHIASQPVG